jgi:hypothetical protein
MNFHNMYLVFLFKSAEAALLLLCHVGTPTRPAHLPIPFQYETFGTQVQQNKTALCSLSLKRISLEVNVRTKKKSGATE